VDTYNVYRPYFVPAAFVIAWVAWWLLGMNWKKGWAALAEGAWVPLVLLGVLVALVWSQMAPGPLASLPNFWWQLGAVTMLISSMLFCGWLQGYFGWTPQEVEIEPAAHADHEHGHEGHGPDAGHGPEYGHVHDHDHGHAPHHHH
jgi:hypothetical protein